MTKYLNLSYRILIFSVLTLAVINLVGSNLLSTHGRTLEEINQQIITTQKDNLYLKTQIAQNSSLSSISQKANAYGFVNIQKPLAFSTPAPVAYVGQ